MEMVKSIGWALTTALMSLPLSVVAEQGGSERVLGLWGSHGTYLELNGDGTFFRAEQLPQDDVFGTFVVRGNVVHFTYDIGNAVHTTAETLHFMSSAENNMQLIDTQQHAVTYQKLRDF